MKFKGSYEFHLTVKEVGLAAGMEWPSGFSNWLMIQADAGTGYWMNAKQNLQLDPGTVLILPPDADGTVRASQVGNLSFSFFCVDPMRLTGLMTLAEQNFFRHAGAREEFAPRFLYPQHPLSIGLRELIRDSKQTGSLHRLQLLQKFIAAFESELESSSNEPEFAEDAKQRLMNFLKTTQTFELINLSFSELADVSRCTPRHLSRIFREVVGMSFRDKRAELRLTQACDLLAATQLKIVDVALESGFQSLSLFNLMFAKRFGTSPGKWRQKHWKARRVGTRRARSGTILVSVSKVNRSRLNGQLAR